MPQKTGVAEAAVLLVHLCRVLNKYNAKLQKQLDTDLSTGKISQAQYDIATNAINTTGQFCTIMRIVSGY